MADRIFQSFLERQYQDGMALAAASDLVKLLPLGGPAADRYVAEFTCRGLVRAPTGQILEAGHFAVGIWFPQDYLRRAEPGEVLTWLGPWNVWHPNILPPAICLGRVAPGTALTDLLHRVYELISYQKVTPREDDALNKPACAWVRGNQHRLPLDRRPLKRKALARATGEL